MKENVPRMCVSLLTHLLQKPLNFLCWFFMKDHILAMSCVMNAVNYWYQKRSWNWLPYKFYHSCLVLWRFQVLILTFFQFFIRSCHLTQYNLYCWWSVIECSKKNSWLGIQKVSFHVLLGFSLKLIKCCSRLAHLTHTSEHGKPAVCKLGYSVATHVQSWLHCACHHRGILCAHQEVLLPCCKACHTNGACQERYTGRVPFWWWGGEGEQFQHFSLMFFFTEGYFIGSFGAIWNSVWNILLRCGLLLYS